MDTLKDKETGIMNFVEKKTLPNSTAVLVLGILSVVVCQLLGIIALVLANSNMKLYRQNPEIYSESSLSNLKAGRICSIVGLALIGFFVLAWVFMFIFAVSIFHLPFDNYK
jgi:hypothetical protein